MYYDPSWMRVNIFLSKIPPECCWWMFCVIFVSLNIARTHNTGQHEIPVKFFFLVVLAMDEHIFMNQLKTNVCIIFNAYKRPHMLQHTEHKIDHKHKRHTHTHKHSFSHTVSMPLARYSNRKIWCITHNHTNVGIRNEWCQAGSERSKWTRASQSQQNFSSIQTNDPTNWTERLPWTDEKRANRTKRAISLGVLFSLSLEKEEFLFALIRFGFLAQFTTKIFFRCF